jgi:hypothetical protein
MPDTRARILVKLSRSEKEIYVKALRKVVEEGGKSLGKKKAIREKDALLLLCHIFLQLDLGGEKSPSPTAESPFRVVYRYCPACRAAAIATSDGPVEVDPEVVERVAGDAEVEEIGLEEEAPPEKAEEDTSPRKPPPNSPKLTRRLILRDGPKCANPECHRRARHGHHLVPRSEGGATEMWNEVALCPCCHAARHAGLLEIEGNPLEGFRFNPSLKKAAPPLDEELKLFASLGIEISRGPSRGADSQSACADKLRRPEKEIALFARGLKRTFGYGLYEAKEWHIEEHAEVSFDGC